MLLSLVVWVGGIVFFAFVLAPTVFTVLPTRHLAGLVVTRSLNILHWMGIVSGFVFIFSSIGHELLTSGSLRILATRHVLLYLMLPLTLVSQFAITPRMHALRTTMGEIDSVAADNPLRLQFNALHAWSTRVEAAVLVLGLAVIFLMARHTKS